MKSGLCRCLPLLVGSCLTLSGAHAQVTQERFAQMITRVSAWTNESYAEGDPSCGACDCNTTNGHYCFNDISTDRTWLTAEAMQDFTFNPAWDVINVSIDIQCRFNTSTTDAIQWDFRVPGVREWSPFNASFSSGDGNCRYRLGNADITNLLGRPWTRADLDNLQLRVRRGDTTSTTFRVRSFRVTATAVPNPCDNDVCSGAFGAGVGETYVDNTCSVVDGPAPSCEDPDFPSSMDVWHKFVAPESRPYLIGVTSDDYDTMITVYDGCGGPELACNDDADFDWQTYTSAVTINAKAGHEYLIRTASVDGSAGAGFIEIAPTAPPSNDLPSGALLVSDGDTVDLDTTDSYADWGKPSCDSLNAPSSKDLWYKFVATQSNECFFDACSDDFQPVVNVYSWPGLTELACSNDDPDSGCAFGASASVSVVAGHEYVIRVAGEGGGFGAATLETWSICLADITWDGFVNGDDFDYYSMLFEDADPDADLNADGFVNGNDYDIFAEHFDLGC